MAFDDEERKWEELGESDPFWAVLSHDGREHGNWDLGDFFAEGERDVAGVTALADLARPDRPTGRALDFGCGVGRLSRALSSQFTSVDGLDVSGSMVARARELVGADHPSCTFAVNKSTGLPFPSATFDLVLSLIVLQHMPPERALAYVAEFVRVLAPDGVAVFQAPERSLGGSRSASPVKRLAADALPRRARDEFYRRFRRGGTVRDLDMWSIPFSRVERTVRRAGGEVLAFVADDAAGPNWRSLRYAVARTASPGPTRDVTV